MSSFIDEARIKVKAGDGGAGTVAWRREKFVPKGGPAGGDGGDGGHVILEVDEGLSTLLDFRYRTEYLAPSGERGGNKDMYGKAGTDLVLQMSATVPVEVYGMGLDALVRRAPQLAGSVHDLRQDELHDRIGHHRAYFHPYRWTSLGLALIEAMTAGLPVLGLPATAAPEAVPGTAGVLSSDVDLLRRTARRWMHEPEEARERGRAARRFALERFGLHRFLDDWDVLLKEVAR